tara:strand:- start:224 stop:568 length:345 start_codon:yes stop_codon:yes gene_type:complete
MKDEIKELLEKYNLTVEQYKEARYNMNGANYFLSKQCDEESEEMWCSVLYFDSDDGVAELTSGSEIFSEEGFIIKLIDCGYCDILFEDMKSIIDIFEDFEKTAHEIIWSTEHAL